MRQKTIKRALAMWLRRNPNMLRMQSTAVALRALTEKGGPLWYVFNDEHSERSRWPWALKMATVEKLVVERQRRLLPRGAARDLQTWSVLQALAPDRRHQGGQAKFFDDILKAVYDRICWADSPKNLLRAKLKRLVAAGKVVELSDDHYVITDKGMDFLKM